MESYAFVIYCCVTNDPAASQLEAMYIYDLPVLWVGMPCGLPGASDSGSLTKLKERCRLGSP